MFGLGKSRVDSIERILEDLIHPVTTSIGSRPSGRLYMDPEEGDDRCLLRAARLSCTGVGQSSGALSQDELVLGLASFAAWMGQGEYLQRLNLDRFQGYARNHNASSLACSVLLMSLIASEPSVSRAVRDKVPSFDFSTEVTQDETTLRIRPDSLTNGVTIACGRLASDFMHHAWGEGESAIGSILLRLPKWRHYRGTRKAVEDRFGTAAADYIVSSDIGEALAGVGPPFKEYAHFGW